MDIKALRFTLKGCADDKRLRILNLLKHKELTVKGLCDILKCSQSVVSKHLARLRLLRVVIDERRGSCVFYRVNRDEDAMQWKIVNFIISQFKDIDEFRKDIQDVEKISGGGVPVPHEDKSTVKWKCLMHESYVTN